MTRIFTFLALFLFASMTHCQVDLDSKEWQEDLRFLQKNIHENYNSLFVKISAEDFDQAVEKLYQAIPKMEDHEVIVGIAELVALFGYGHTQLNLNNWGGLNKSAFSQIPLKFYQFHDGVYIQGIHKDYEQFLGAKIIKIGDKTIDEAIQAVYPVVSAENESFFKAYGIYYLAVPEVLHAKGVIKNKDRVPVVMEKDGKTLKYEFNTIDTYRFPGRYTFIQQEGNWLDARDQSKTPLWLKNLNLIYFYEYLPESKTVYIRHSQIQNDASEPIEAFYARVFDFIENNEVEKLVIDVRLNGGGNNFLNKPIITGIIETQKINQRGKLFVITGRNTFSACQNLVNEMENYTNALFVGEPTAENVNFFGDNRSLNLPNSQLPIRLSFAWWQDKYPWDNRQWTTPHIATDLTFKDYANNHDPAMAAILNYKDEPPIKDQLSDLAAKGDIDQAVEMVSKYVKDPKYRYNNDIESQINTFGYELINLGDYKQAIRIFTLNTKIYPQSANTWDSLAESYWRSGDKENAIKYYNKAISIDPKGRTGDNARSMIQRIQNGQ